MTRLLSQKETAARLGLSVSRVREMDLPRVALPSSRAGGRPQMRYPEDLLDEYIRRYLVVPLPR